MAKDIEINVKTGGESVRNLRAELKEAVKEAQLLMASGQANTEAYDKAAQKAGELRDIIGDTNTQIASLATGSKFEQLSNNLGNVGDKIANLNFAGAASDAKILVNISKTLTFKEATTGLKDLGKTFLTLGKALLTNPLFLLAGAITLIVVAIVKLMDKLGFLKAITDAVGKVFEWFTYILEKAEEGLNALSDAMRGTTKQMDAFMAKQADMLSEGLKKQTEATDARIDNMDREIRIAKLRGEDTRKLEEEKLRQIALRNKAEVNAMKMAYIVAEKTGSKTKEELAEMKKEIQSLVGVYKSSVIDIAEFNKKTDKEEEDKRKENQRKAVDAAKATAEKQKQYDRERFNFQRQLEDARLALLEVSEENEIYQLNIKYARLIEDTLRNEKLLASEKELLIKELEAQQLKSQSELRDKYRKQELDAEKNFLKLITDLTAEELSPAEKIRKEYEDKLLALEEGTTEEMKQRQEYFDALLEMERQYNEQVDLMNEETAKRLKENSDRIAKEKEDARLADIAADLAIRDAKIQIAEDLNNGLNAIGNAFIKDQERLENFNKATALIQIGVDTARAISALVAASQANPTNAATFGAAGVAQFISGMVQITTNIAKAKQILSNPGASVAGASSVSSSSTVATPAAISSTQNNIPSFNMFGTAGNSNNNQPQTIQIGISEVTDTMSTVNNISELNRM